LADEHADMVHVEEFDWDTKAEDRYVTTASPPDDRSIVLVVAWADRSTKHVKVTRIISARAATRAERRRYAKAICGE
jgi:uncharacterized DUF497 family protein